jgi:ribosome-associated protein
MRDVFIQPGLIIPGRELDVSVARSGGPGGQNVNKVSSKVTLSWKVGMTTSLSSPVVDRLCKLAAGRINAEGELQITSQEYRDQPANLDTCVLKLRRLILRALSPPKTRKPTRPTRGSRERRLESKAIQSRRKAGRRNGTWD